MIIIPTNPPCGREALAVPTVQRDMRAQTEHFSSEFPTKCGRLPTCAAFTAGSAFHAEDWFGGGAVGTPWAVLKASSLGFPTSTRQSNSQLTTHHKMKSIFPSPLLSGQLVCELFSFVCRLLRAGPLGFSLWIPALI